MTVPTTSIVILTRNGLDLTRACVESIARCTPEPHELVFVDNASTDGTLDYLHALDAFVVDNDRNLGFGGGCNQGIAAATGERTLLLNNDVVVTPGWLHALHAALDLSPSTGFAGPRSNRIAGHQLVGCVGYDEQSLDGLDAWSGRWCAEHAGQVTATARIIGMCLLLERAVIERIGGFDLRYGIGNLEDDDLCMRATVAGFGGVIAHDSFVHHVGSQTFAADGVDYRASMAANVRHFATKWDLGERDVDRVAGSYRVDRLLERATWDPTRHVEPLVATSEPHARVELPDASSTVVAVCCDRLDPRSSERCIDHALDGFGPRDDVTVLVRVDPRDGHALEALERTADRVGDAQLPDVAVLSRRDENDLAVLQRADAVVVDGRFARARELLARLAGAQVVPVRSAAGESPTKPR